MSFYGKAGRCVLTAVTALAVVTGFADIGLYQTLGLTYLLVPPQPPQRDEDSETLVFIIYNELLWLGRKVSSLCIVDVTRR